MFYRFKPLRYRLVCSGLMWVAITVNLLITWETNADPDVVTVSFFMTLSVMVFCCLSVLWVLKRPGPAETERTGGNTMKRRAFNIISLNLGILLASYLPTLVISSLVSVLPMAIFIYLYQPALLMTVLSGSVQPLLHLHKAGKLAKIWALCSVKP